ncbi:MAG: hypothetical protein WDO15_17005 [Bacteroidota bacterium]
MCVIVAGLCITALVVALIVLIRTNRIQKKEAAELEQRMQERTTELQGYVDSFQRSKAERNFFLDALSKRINASLATMKGLGKIATTYENMPPELVKNIDVTADTLADILQQIAHEKKL